MDEEECQRGCINTNTAGKDAPSTYDWDEESESKGAQSCGKEEGILSRQCHFADKTQGIVLDMVGEIGGKHSRAYKGDDDRKYHQSFVSF